MTTPTRVGFRSSEDPAFYPRRFFLQRDLDPSGVSGTGRVADGVLWPDGTCSVRWHGQHPSVAFWATWAAMVAVHGHHGATRVVWLD